MLDRSAIRPTISVTDLQRAKKFYGETLGLRAEGEMDGHISYKAGDGTSLIVFARQNAPKAENTVASFAVENVEAVVKWLKGRGVVFEEYDTPGLKTAGGIATIGDTKGAWFKDPDGNILAVVAAWTKS